MKNLCSERVDEPQAPEKYQEYIAAMDHPKFCACRLCCGAGDVCKLASLTKLVQQDRQQFFTHYPQFVLSADQIEEMLVKGVGSMLDRMTAAVIAHEASLDPVEEGAVK